MRARLVPVGIRDAPTHGQCPAGEVEVGQVEAGDLRSTHGVDGDQADNEACGGTVQPFQGSCQPIAGQRPRQVHSPDSCSPVVGLRKISRSCLRARKMLRSTLSIPRATLPA